MMIDRSQGAIVSQQSVVVVCHKRFFVTVMIQTRFLMCWLFLCHGKENTDLCCVMSWRAYITTFQVPIDPGPVETATLPSPSDYICWRNAQVDNSIVLVGPHRHLKEKRIMVRLCRILRSSLLVLTLTSVTIASLPPPGSGKVHSKIPSSSSSTSELLNGDSDSGQRAQSSSASSQHAAPSSPNSKPGTKPISSNKETRVSSKRSPAAGSLAAASLRRLKKEYRDIVRAGICYDWVNGRPVLAASTSSSSSSSSSMASKATTTTSTKSPSPQKNNNNDDDNSSSRTDETQQFLCLGPLASNLRDWHFSFYGAQGSPYESGLYHGRILLPKDYPATPPRVQLWTPSGRFQPHADICLSASSYHPESWTPKWNILALVQALRLHMITNPNELGGISRTRQEIMDLARQSLYWKVSWKVGNTWVTVDHAKLRKQRVLHSYNDDAEHSIPSMSDHDSTFTQTNQDESQELFSSIDSTTTDSENEISSSHTTTVVAQRKKRSRRPKSSGNIPIRSNGQFRVTKTVSSAVYSILSSLLKSPFSMFILSFAAILWLL